MKVQHWLLLGQEPSGLGCHVGALRIGAIGDLGFHQGSEHPTRADGIDRDAVVRQLQGGDLGRAQHAVLGCDIGDLVGARDEAVSRGDVDDPAPTRAFIAGMAARIVWNTEDRLSAMMASQRSTGNSSRGETNWIPALLTRMSNPPKARWVAATRSAACAASVRSAPW